MKDMEKYYQSLIEQFTLLDDTFMRLIFKDIKCTQLLIRTILDNLTLEIKMLEVQSSINNMLTKSVIMDVLATDKNGDIYNIEVQRANEGANRKRARYHSSILDTNIIYVNTGIQDDSNLGKLMHDFRCSNPQDMNYEVLKEQVQLYKQDERKVKDMCKIMEQLREDGRIEGKIEGKIEERINTIINLYKNNVGIDIISKSVSISEEEVKDILIKNKVLQ